ncbi:MAG: DUF2330 domain-containing protein [Bacteroidetes bacterium]|nr:DUF2330 domain-containing protein [Bacteroidota bacterium]
MKIRSLFSLILIASALNSSAFCGFYVAKAGAELFNNKSQIILVRDGQKSVITMSNDFSGNVDDFAMVVPVPTVLKREQIRIAESSIFDKLDTYSGPRLVEYYDPNPCQTRVLYESVANAYTKRKSDMLMDKETPEDEYNVTIEAQYAVGEYDILILSAKESEGLKNWLIQNGYKIPAKAERVLEPYIKNNLKFFVVKVNADVHAMQGYQNLRPLQIEFESEKFMLPIRLGMANSKGEQDMIVYAFTKTGRVETANYRTVEIPSNRNIPVFVKEKFGQFYTDLFDKSHKTAGKNSVFVEYAWTVTPSFGGVKCDPCVGPPPIFADLEQAGVWWLKDNKQADVFFTRLHVRYAEEKFPEDLLFLTTPNRTHFQGRYILTHPASGELNCDDAKEYLSELKSRRQKELYELSALTDWNTSKYTKYVSEGSSWIDEKKESSPILKPHNDEPGNNLPWLRWITILVVSGVMLFSLKNIAAGIRQVQNN